MRLQSRTLPGPVSLRAALSLFVEKVRESCFMPMRRPEASRSAEERDFAGEVSHSSQSAAKRDSLSIVFRNCTYFSLTSINTQIKHVFARVSAVIEKPCKFCTGSF